MSDEGVGIRIGAHGGKVHVRFDKPIEHISFTPKEVHALIDSLLEQNGRAAKQDPPEVLEAQKPDRTQPIVGKCLNCNIPKRANEIQCPACGYPWKE